MQDRYFTDEELVSYLDGEADFAPVEEIAEELKIDSSNIRELTDAVMEQLRRDSAVSGSRRGGR